jgi:hypothetical protein
MVRIGRFAAALVAFLSVVSAVGAQALQRLTVGSFVLSADTDRPQVDAPFHLIVTLHVRERVAQIENLELPILAELELLGDERRLESGASGTAYRETITVVAHHAGSIAIGPAVLQAVDARDHRAKQYSTNGLALNVRGAANTVPLVESTAARLAWIALRLVLWIAGALCAVAVLVLVFRRRSAIPAAVAPSAEPAPPPPVRTFLPHEELREALTVLRAEPTRATAVRVRALAWRVHGASDGETLADVLLRPAANEPAVRDVLRSLERAAFTYDADLRAAIDSACAALARYLA